MPSPDQPREPPGLGTHRTWSQAPASRPYDGIAGGRDACGLGGSGGLVWRGVGTPPYGPEAGPVDAKTVGPVGDPPFGEKAYSTTLVINP